MRRREPQRYAFSGRPGMSFVPTPPQLNSSRRVPMRTPGCVVLDLRLPGSSGLEVQRALAQLEDPLPVIFLSGQGDVPDSVEAMKGGAVDFLMKTADGAQLLDAVSRALDRDAEDRRRRGRLRELHARHATLSPREREVLAHSDQRSVEQAGRLRSRNFRADDEDPSSPRAREDAGGIDCRSRAHGERSGNRPGRQRPVTPRGYRGGAASSVGCAWCRHDSALSARCRSGG